MVAFGRGGNIKGREEMEVYQMTPRFLTWTIWWIIMTVIVIRIKEEGPDLVVADELEEMGG